jgi:hypothetical protein
MRQADVMVPFPIRIFDGAWHVLMVKPTHWIKCANGHHARILSRSMLLVNQAATNRQSGAKFSRELLSTALVLDRYVLTLTAKLCRYYAAGPAQFGKASADRKVR